MITFKFGKFKGQTLEEVANSEEGVRWLEWLIEQPCEGEYADSNRKRNKEIEDYLGGILPAKAKETVLKSGEAKKTITGEQVIIAKLDEIISNGEKIISLISGQK